MKKTIHVARKDHFMCPVFAKLLACLLMQWRLLLWDQILLCTFTAKVNHLYVREKSTHWKKADPCSDENNKTEFWKHKQIKLLICPRRGRENWSSKQIKINTVTGNKRTRLFPKGTQNYIVFDLDEMLVFPSLYCTYIVRAFRGRASCLFWNAGYV